MGVGEGGEGRGMGETKKMGGGPWAQSSWAVQVSGNLGLAVVPLFL
jgi:hypothetical protein